MSKLYERIREARRLTGLTQEMLAAELGISRSAVAQWEMADGTAPSVENLIAVARRSGLHFEYLATGRGEPRFGPAQLITEEEARYHPLSEQQRQLLAAFEQLRPRQRSALLELIQSPGPRRRR
ncbi:MAG TPA: helix-turn-helix transcriptional regulator [Stenotrophomonas sp.]|nr:helix-turn-helix transcriptional regulator [Stenotrophomonas sp.]